MSASSISPALSIMFGRPGGSRRRGESRRLGLRVRLGAAAAVAALSILASPAAAIAAVNLPQTGPSPAAQATGGGAHALEAVASRAGQTGRNVAMSLIGLALAVAAIVLAFRRDFKEAAAVFAVGLVCILLATPAGVALLKGTVKALVGS